MLTALSLNMVNTEESYSRFPAARAAGTAISFHNYLFEHLASLGTSRSVPVMLPVILHPTRPALLTLFAARYGAAPPAAIADTCLMTFS